MKNHVYIYLHNFNEESPAMLEFKFVQFDDIDDDNDSHTYVRDSTNGRIYEVSPVSHSAPSYKDEFIKRLRSNNIKYIIDHDSKNIFINVNSFCSLDHLERICVPGLQKASDETSLSKTVDCYIYDKMVSHLDENRSYSAERIQHEESPSEETKTDNEIISINENENNIILVSIDEILLSEYGYDEGLKSKIQNCINTIAYKINNEEVINWEDISQIFDPKSQAASTKNALDYRENLYIELLQFLNENILLRDTPYKIELYRYMIDIYALISKENENFSLFRFEMHNLVGLIIGETETENYDKIRSLMEERFRYILQAGDNYQQLINASFHQLCFRKGIGNYQTNIKCDEDTLIHLSRIIANQALQNEPKECKMLENESIESRTNIYPLTTRGVQFHSNNFGINDQTIDESSQTNQRDNNTTVNLA